MNSSYVLVKPRFSEKGTAMQEENRYAFLVHPDANKAEIKKAIESMFGVKVLAVNVVRRRPVERKRHGRVIGQTQGYKKAYVKLSDGDKIEFFEGV